MFGGAVNFENFVGIYVRDDSIDIDEGYIGSITNALVIQQESDGNRCVEADESDPTVRKLMTLFKICLLAV